MAATLDQDRYRGRDDDVVLNSASFTHALNTNWTQLANTPFRIRFLIQETGTGSNANAKFTLYYSRNGGTYRQMAEGEYLAPSPSDFYGNGGTTTQVLGAGTYISGESLAGVEDAVITGNVDVETNKEFEVEFCAFIDASITAEGDTFDLRVRRNAVALDTYTATPQITATLPPTPNVVGFTGDVIYEFPCDDLYGAGGWTAINEYFGTGNNHTHPPSIQPLLVQLAVSSFRMKALGVAGPGLFPPGAEDTARHVVSGLAAGRYVYEYYQVEHDEGTRRTRLLSGPSEVEVMLIEGTEALGETLWQGPFHHVFDHVGGDLVLEIYYKTVDVPTDTNTGIKDIAMMIREYVGVGTVGLTASGTVTAGPVPPTPPPTNRPVIPGQIY